MPPALRTCRSRFSRRTPCRAEIQHGFAVLFALAAWSLGGPVAVAEPVCFRNDVMAVLSKAGCKQGTCHGNQNGKNGFKLSLRGYDADYDYNVLVNELQGRRVNRVEPDKSREDRDMQLPEEVCREGGAERWGRVSQPVMGGGKAPCASGLSPGGAKLGGAGKAVPSFYLRPHAQHGLLIKPQSNDSEMQLAALQIPLPRALEWLGSSVLLSPFGLYPPDPATPAHMPTAFVRASGGYATVNSDSVAGITKAAPAPANPRAAMICTGLSKISGAADASVFNERGLSCLNLANGMQDIHTPGERIAALPGFRLASESPFFKEFTVVCPRPPAALLAALLAQGIAGGLDVSDRIANGLTVAVTELNTRAEIDRLVAALRAAGAGG